MAQLSDDSVAFGGALMTVAEMQALLRERLEPVIGTARIRIQQARGRVLAVDSMSPINLPPFDAMVPPAYKPTETTEGKAWAQKVADSDAFVFVTPEYNRSIPSSLKNAIDYLVAEWKEKPAAIISYGYIDGGQSATKHLQDILDWLKMRNVGELMAINFSQETFDENGQFKDVDASLGVIKEAFVTSLQAIEKA